VTDIFKFDPKYLEIEERYKSIKAEIPDEDSDEESGSGSDDDDSEEEEGK
jgi:pre-mRNA-splicing factor CWC22